MPADSHLHSPTPEEIMAYLDGEASADDAVTIASHLAGCKECEMVADSLRHVTQRIAEWRVEPAPASMQAPARRGRLLSWRSSRFVLASLTAAAALLVVISTTARSPRRTIRAEPVSQVTSAIDSLQPSGGVVGGVVGGEVGSLRRDLANKNQIASGGPQSAEASQVRGRLPAIIRTASLRIVAKEFEGVRANVEALVAGAGGFVDQMTITGDTSTARVLQGTLRVPGDRLAGVLAQLRRMGQVVEDTQGAQDVTDEIVDLDARLNNARATEQRLADILRNRTGKLSDVLEVEREIARVRLDIERLDAEKTNMGRRVAYSTIGLQISEERKASLDGPLSLATRIRVAATDGLESAFESVAVTILILLRAGPSLILWGTAAGIIWMFARRIKREPSA